MGSIHALGTLVNTSSFGSSPHSHTIFQIIMTNKSALFSQTSLTRRRNLRNEGLGTMEGLGKKDYRSHVPNTIYVIPLTLPPPIRKRFFRTASCLIELSPVKTYRGCQPLHTLIVCIALLNASEFSRSTTQCAVEIAILCSSHTRKENILWVESNCVRYPRRRRIS